MTRPPAFQTYSNDLLALFVGLSLPALGAVHRLFLVMWGQAADYSSLIDDDTMLARTVGCSLDDWKGLRQEIQHPARPIFQEKDGRLISPYLRQEASKQRKYRKLQAEKSKKGVEARVTRGLSAGASTDEARVTSPTPTPIPIPIPSSSSFSKEKENTHTLLKKGRVGVSSFSSKKDLSQEPEADRTQTPQAYTIWRTEAAQAAFELFWKAYPNKVAPGPVKEWFRTHSVTPNLISDIEIAIKRQATTRAWIRDEGKYIPHPAKWLKEECWQDEGLKVKRQLVY
jgi:hypothetical protein